MLIKALCDYYDILVKAGNVPRPGYSRQEISYLVALNKDGTLNGVVDNRTTEMQKRKNGKQKEVIVPKAMMMPLPATNPSKIAANAVDCRPNYIFGVVNEKDEKKYLKAKEKAQKSHEDFVKVNRAVVDKIPHKSPIVQAFASFLEKWNPEQEKDNPHLVNLGKELDSRKFAFCLAGSPDILLHEDKDLVKLLVDTASVDEGMKAVCSITGEQKNIARLHDKIKNIFGGQSSGTALVCFNNESEESYGFSQSYNSAISEDAMTKYTIALNMLTVDEKHKIVLDDLTIVYWAMNARENEEDLLNAIIEPDTEQDGQSATENMLNSLLKDAVDGKIARDRINSLDTIDANVDFYIVGIKPNSSRLSIKFINKRKYGDLLQNIAQFQLDMQLRKQPKLISLSWLVSQMKSPKSNKEKIDPSFMARLFDTVINNKPLPLSLLATAIRRVRIDAGLSKEEIKKYKVNNGVKVGIIKACLNRNSWALGNKEEIKLSLDVNSKNQAYLCGRLFAVLEGIQQLSTGGKGLNRTIKDTYFASATATPAFIFPKILRLSQYHLKKLGGKNEEAKKLNEKIGEIIDSINGEFPVTLSLLEQGKFIIGYYQQRPFITKIIEGKKS